MSSVEMIETAFVIVGFFSGIIGDDDFPRNLKKGAFFFSH